MPTPYPIIDLHCDLLSYLAHIPHAAPERTSDIGVALPYLQAGNVVMQVLALFTTTQPGSTQSTQQQIQAFQKLIKRTEYTPLQNRNFEVAPHPHGQITVLPAIENASGFCEAEEPLSNGLERLDNIIAQLQTILYISLTHHDENRFGGGNYSNNIGLKRDGEALLEYLSGRRIAVDVSHASDQLAFDIFTFIAQHQLDISIIASHSNFRTIWPHVRNLPEELSQEIIHQKGLIGINFLRAYVDDDQPDTLLSHIRYGLEKGGEDALAMGADFFYTRDFYDPSRYPLYHPQHENAGRYPGIMEKLSQANVSDTQLDKLSHRNVIAYLNRQQLVDQI